MNNESFHRSSDQLQAFVDGALDLQEASVVRVHIDECEECRRRVAEIRRLDRLARELPMDAAPAGFTERVVGQLGMFRKPSLLVRAVSFLPYLFGLLVVLSVITLTFLAFGVIGPGTTATEAGTLGKGTAEIERYVSVVSAFITNIAGSVLPFFRERGSISLWILVAVALMAFLGVDRLVGRRVLSR